MKLPPIKIDVEARLASHRATRCKHPKTEIRKHIDAKAFQIKEQCTVCGDLIGAVKKKTDFTADQIAAMPEWDKELKQTYWKDRNEYYDSLKQKTEYERYQEWKKQYESYLQTPEWKTKRKKVLNRSNHLCEGCLSEKATEVHHTTYKHAGEEFLFELVALCATCHERFHHDTFPKPPAPSAPQSKTKIC